MAATSIARSPVPTCFNGTPMRGNTWHKALLTVAALTLGCHREAPTPEQCLGLAQGVLSSAPGRALDTASLRSLTLRCIDEPFDKRVVECVSDGYSATTCMTLVPPQASER